MTAAVETCDVDGLRLLDGEVGRPEPAPREAPRRVRRVGRVRVEVAARPLPGVLGNEDVFCTEYGGGFVGMSFRFYDPATGPLVDLLGRQPPARPSRSTGDRLDHGRRRRVRGRRHVEGAPSVCASRGRESRPRRRAGSRRSPTTTARRGRPTGSWTSRARWEVAARGGVPPLRGHPPLKSAMNALEQTQRRAPTSPRGEAANAEPSLALGDTILKWYNVAPDDAPVPSRSGPSRACLRDASAAISSARSASSASCPPSLRRGLLLPPRLHLAQRERAVGDGLGEERRERRPLPPWPTDGRAPTHVLRVGARGRVPRPGGVDPLPPFTTRQGREGRVPARRLLRRRLTVSVPEGTELLIVRVERGGPWTGRRTCASRSSGTDQRTS